MSATADDIDAALQARAAQGASAPSSGDDIEDALQARAAGKPVGQTPAAPPRRTLYDPSKPAIGDSVEQVGHQMLSGAYHSVVGGYKGLVKLATGDGLDAATQAIQDEQSKAYQAPQSTLKTVVESPYNPLNYPQEAGDWAADKNAALGGSPAVSAGLKAAPAAVMAAAGIAGPRMLRGAAPEVDAQTALNKSYALSGQNMGAAASAPDLTASSLPLQSAIEEASAAGTKPVNADAIAKHMKADEFGVQLTKGQATGDAAQLADEFNTRNQNPAFAERKVQTNQKLIDGINGIKEDVAPGAAVAHEDNAQTVIDAYKDKYSPIAADASAKWKKFQDAAGGALPLEPGDFTAQIGAALKKSGKTRYLPADVAGDIKDIDDGEPFTVERWDNLKTNLAGAQRTAEKSGNGNAGLAISAARDAVENYQFPNLDPKLAAMNSDARAATAAKYKMLRSDPAMDAAVNDGVPRGQLSPEAKGYMEKYFLKGNKADLSNAQKNLAGNPDAQGAIAGSVTNELKKAAGIDLYRNDGNFSQSGYNTRLNELQPRIKYLMPGEAADKAFRLGDVARDAMRQPTGPAFNNSGTSTAAKLAKRIGSGVVGTAEHLANAATGKLKLGTGAREELENWRDSKWVEDSLKPGAGIER